MNLRAFLRTRRQRKARKRYEREKARRESHRDGQSLDRADDFAKTIGGSGSF